MRYISTALFAEGPTDHDFLSPILKRIISNHCYAHAESLVEVGDVLVLRSPDRVKAESRAARITEAARDAKDAFNVLFIHSDGNGDIQRAEQDRIQPARQKIEEELGLDHKRVISVIPKRETEAWALADTEAVRVSFGTRLTDKDLGLNPDPKFVEGILDPKSKLADVYRQIVGRRRRGQSASSYLPIIAERANIGTLCRIPSFRTLHDHMDEALKMLYII